MRQVIDKLWELQTTLSRLAEKEKSLTNQPESFAELDRQYQTSTEEIERLRKRIDDLQRERRKIDADLQDEQERLKKFQGQLMQVKNQQQYAAAWKEIDAARKKVKDLEEEVLKRMTEIETIETDLKARETPYAELKGRHDAAHAEWQGSLGDLRAEAEKIRTSAEAIEQAIPGKLLGDFHRIFKQRQGIAVARVINDACGVCRVRIRPQATQQLKRGELVICEGCRRILYLERIA